MEALAVRQFYYIFFRVSKSNLTLLGVNTKKKYAFYDSVSYIKLFMTTMKMKNGKQYGNGNYEAGGAGIHSKHNILSGTVHEYHKNKRFLQ